MTGSDMAVRTRLFALLEGEAFTRVAIAPAVANPAVRAAAIERLAAGDLAGLSWMSADWLERASDPARFLPGAKSVILVALAYQRPSGSTRGGGDGEPGPPRGRIAAYARGRDYHRVFEKKLRRVARAIREEFGAEARPTVDYGPLLERPLAAAGGMGWQGKSTMLLVPGIGPWVLLGAIATTLALEAGEPLAKSCGACTRCVVACPTGALGSDGSVLDARLCISYHTIENRGPIPRELRSKFGAWIFGCDECLTSCPVGSHSSFATEADFAPADIEAEGPDLHAILALDEEQFASRFRGRAIMRAKRDGLVRNACVALGNIGTAADLPALAGALADISPLVRGHAAWAVAAIAVRHRSASEVARASLCAALAGEDAPIVRQELVAALDEMPE